MTSYFGSTDKQAMSDSTRGNTWYMVKTFCLVDCWADDEIEVDMEKFHKEHIIIVVFNDRYFKREEKVSAKDTVSHQINKTGLEYIFFNC